MEKINPLGHTDLQKEEFDVEKPFVVCHMFVSLDGKIDGAFMRDPAAVPARTEYGKLRAFYDCQAALYGTVTMARSFAAGWLEETPRSQEQYPREDWIAPAEADQYVISVDPQGKLRWDSPYIEKPGRPRAHAIEVLTDQASDDYVAYLRHVGVSYLFAGKDTLDCRLLLHKLKATIGIKSVMLAGGGYMNGSLLAEGLVDEVSLVIAPVADGGTASVSSFEQYQTRPGVLASLSLLDVKRLEGDSLWLRYGLRQENR